MIEIFVCSAMSLRLESTQASGGTAGLLDLQSQRPCTSTDIQKKKIYIYI